MKYAKRAVGRCSLLISFFGSFFQSSSSHPKNNNSLSALTNAPRFEISLPWIGPTPARLAAAAQSLHASVDLCANRETKSLPCFTRPTAWSGTGDREERVRWRVSWRRVGDRLGEWVYLWVRHMSCAWKCERSP